MFVDARNRPVEPDHDVFGDSWTPFDRRMGSAEEIRLRYPSRELAFEPGGPSGPNRTRGRASVKPWVSDVEIPTLPKEG